MSKDRKNQGGGTGAGRETLAVMQHQREVTYIDRDDPRLPMYLQNVTEPQQPWPNGGDKPRYLGGPGKSLLP